MAKKSGVPGGELLPAGHGHTHGSVRPALSGADRRRVRVILAAIVIPLAVAVLAGLIALWPTGDSKIGSVPLTSKATSQKIAEVTSIAHKPDDLGQVEVKARIDGAEVPVQVPFDIALNGIHQGSHIKVLFQPSGLDGGGTPYIYLDTVRTVPLLALVAVYLAIVLLVAGRKGLAAVVGLAVSLAVVALFMLPALIAGSSPLLIVLVGAGAMMFASIYLAHGISIRTTTAVIGTFVGLVVTGLIAAGMIRWAAMSGTATEEAIALLTQVPGLKMNQILLCGMILAGLGALNDVTITQVSTVWELHNANPAASRAQVIKAAMTVGRDHIASTVYTLAFAYVGTALPLLMAAALIDRSVGDLLTIAQIAEEIIRTLVASIGLILAIPLTTALAAALAPVAPTAQERNQ
ncbi:putative membrane protein [Arcanobacterium wilhelmae]|uniref:Membrane protein n=1 Tax=Arcanobacterium wilhelmae TaxID=1803177 RepID=A0ABT9N946_9ACTO|nr:YibE/F family protein [Arcanobacterium wilhelmae]MDP9800229.1 putative membrane protein [Arcanobacterium wilhelmae]WFN89668.1 YibE/F family protein [Arcanobacterium wilhelmae]